MKKRLFMLMMAGLMVFGTAAMSVYAEEETEVTEEAGDVPEIEWELYEAEIEDNEAWAGDFYKFNEIALKMYVPEVFEEVELTDDDREEGYIAYFNLGDEMGVGVQYVDMDSMELEDYAELLVEELEIDEDNIEAVMVNGFPALIYSFDNDGTETAVVSIATEKGYIIEFAFGPVDEEDKAAVTEVMMASIQQA